jgi:pilus assembly protein Flp/PilA
MVDYIKMIRDLYVPQLDTEEEGQGMVEYGLILVLVAIAAIVTLGLLGDQLGEIFSSVTDTLSGED